MKKDKWNDSTIFAILYLADKFHQILTPSEREFIQQIATSDSIVSWNLDPEQNKKLGQLLSDIFKSKPNQQLLRGSGNNRILEIILDGLGESDTTFPFLTQKEEFYLNQIKSIRSMSSTQIKNLLITTLPSEWEYQFKQETMNSIFYQISFNYQQQLNKQVKQEQKIENLLKEFLSTCTKDDDQYNFLLTAIEDAKSNNEENKQDFDTFISCLKSLQNLKYFLNRSHFFIKKGRNDKNEDEQDWFQLMSLAGLKIQASSLHIENVLEFLNYSVDLKISQIMEIIQKRIPENWTRAQLNVLLEIKFKKLMRKKNGLENEEQLDRWNCAIGKILAGHTEEEQNLNLMRILNSKLGEEIQLTDKSTIVDIYTLLEMVEKLGNSMRTLTNQILEKMNRVPFSDWKTLIFEQELLRKWPQSIVTRIIKTTEKIDLQLILEFVNLFLGIPDNSISLHVVEELLEDISNDKLILDAEIMQVLSKSPKSSWTKILEDHTKKCKAQIRTFSELLKLLKAEVRNGSIQHLLEGDKLSNIIKSIGSAQEKPPKIIPEISNNILKNWTKEDIKNWAIEFKSKPTQDKLDLISSSSAICEILAIIGQGLVLAKGFPPRNVQFIAVLLLLDVETPGNGKRGRLAEIATGEGKTFITAMVAILKGLCGFDVDVVTSSSVLAVDNARDMSELYQLFNLSVGNNCDEYCEKDEKERGKRYQNTIIYGDLASFQRDVLLTKFFGKNITQNRVPGVIIVDEVDSMLLDKGENILYLSHNIPDLKFLRPILMEIWQVIHAPDVCRGTSSDMARVSHYIKERLEKNELQCPKYLKKFALSRLPRWIRNAYLAERMVENDPYILADTEKQGRQIVIMDKDTGVEQTQMHWSHGLHQFLQLKHSDKMSSESLKAIFISNLSYFKQFQGIFYGITGTLGSQSERALLSQCYDVDSFTLPRFKPRKCIGEKGIIQNNEKDWLKSIVETVRTKIVENQRAVLIIAQTVEAVDKITKELAHFQNVYSYKSAFDSKFQERFGENQVQIGQIIIATNLAGRGTDLKVGKELESNGGLHVIMSYMPGNIRIEEQAFGRTARVGQPGTVQFILQNSDINTSIEQLQRERDETEGKRLDDFRQKTLQRIEMEQELCQKFSNLFETIHERFKNAADKETSKLSKWASAISGVQGKTTNVLYIQLQLEFLKNRWAIWLDSMTEKLDLLHVTGKEDIIDEFSKFESAMLRIQEQKIGFLFAAAPCDFIKLGRHFECLNKIQDAISCFDQVIKNDPDYSESAHYYKAGCLLRLDSEGGRREGMMHLKIAKKKIQQRMNQLESSNEILRVVDEIRTRAGSSTKASRFEIQVQNELKILYTFMSSIDDAIGRRVDEDVFTKTHGIIDSSEGEKLFEELRTTENSLFKNYRVSKKIRVNEKNELEIRAESGEKKFKPVEMPQRFFYCKDQISKILKKKVTGGYEERIIEADSFRKIVWTREDLWKALIKHKLIQNPVAEEILKIEFNEEEFEDFEMPENLVYYKDNVGDILKENHGKHYKLTLLEKLSLSPAQIQNLEDQLIHSKILNKESIVRANLSPGKIKYDSSKQELHGIPEELSSFQTIIEDLVMSDQLSLKTEILQHEISLEADVIVASTQIWKYLLNVQVIKMCNLDFKYSTEKKVIDNRLESIEKGLKSNVKLKEIFDEYHRREKNVSDSDREKQYNEHLENIIGAVKGCIGTLRQFQKHEVDYNDLDLYFQTGDFPPELNEYTELTFANVLTLAEKKSYWNWGAICVGLFGLAQIIAGILLTYCTGGLGIVFGAALIAEGAGDIFFAVESTLRKNFSWKSYALHKAVSLTITVITFGIGAYFKTGAQATAAIGKLALAKLIAATTARIIIQQTGFALLNIGIEYSLDKIRKQLMQSFETQLKNKVEETCEQELKLLDSKLDRLYAASYENGQAEKLIKEALTNVMAKLRETTLGQTIGTYAHRAVLNVMNTLQYHLASKGSGKVKLMMNLFTAVKEVSTFYKVLTSIMELAKLAPEIIQQLGQEIEKKINTLKSQGKKEVKKSKEQDQMFLKFKEDFKDNVKLTIVDELLSRVQHEYVQPAIQAMAHQLLMQIQSWIESGAKKIFNNFTNSNKGETERIGEYKENDQQKNSKGGKDEVGNEKDAKSNDDVVDIKELSENTQIKDGQGNEIPLAELRKSQGDDVQIYKKDGEYYYERQSYEKYIDQTTNLNKNSGEFQINMYAREEDSTVELINEDGEVIQKFNDGKEKTRKIMQIKNADGTIHFSPVDENNKPVNIPQDTSTTNSCLHQCFTFYKSLDANGNAENAIRDATCPETIQNVISQVTNASKQDPVLRQMYESDNFNPNSGVFGGTSPDGAMLTYDGKPVYLTQSSVSGFIREKSATDEIKEISFLDFEFDCKKGQITLVHYPATPTTPEHYISIDNRKPLCLLASNTQLTPDMVNVVSPTTKIDPSDDRSNYAGSYGELAAKRIKRQSLLRPDGLPGFRPKDVTINVKPPQSMGPSEVDNYLNTFRDKFRFAKEIKVPQPQPRP